MGPWRYAASRYSKSQAPRSQRRYPIGDGSCCSFRVDETATDRVTGLLAQRESSRPRLG